MLDTLNPKELASLKLVTLKENETLFNEGDFCDCVGIIKSGTIKISSYSPSGKELIYNIMNKDEIFGNNLIFSNNKYYMGDVSAIKDSEVYLINEENLLNLLKTNDRFLVAYLTLQANATKNLNFTMKLLSFDNAKERFMFYLRNNDNKISFESITSLANTLHLTRETTSRTISYLLLKKKITRDKNIIKATR